MKTILTGAVIACTFATSIFAQALRVDVIAMNSNDDASSSLDVCIIEFNVQNNTSVDIGLGLEVFPAYQAGSFSSMVAPAGTSFGRKNEVGFYGLPAGGSMQNNVRILGAICDEIETLELVPLCQEADGTSCNEAIEISPASVVATRIKGGPTAGGREVIAYAGPVGPLHGQIMISTAGGTPLLMLDMVQHEGDTASGSYVAAPAICEAAGLSAGCSFSGQEGETEFARVLNETQGSLGTRFSNADEGRVSFHWDMTTGAGFMRNIAGTLNLPVTVEIVQ